MGELIFLAVVLLLNVLAYLLTYINYRKDCKEIGREKLAVSLKERMQALFMCLTLPCILGWLLRKR